MKLLQKTAAVLTAFALACSCTLPAFAEAATAQSIKKDENVFLILNSDGSVNQQIVSDWLHSNNAFANTADESVLQNIVNLKSDVKPVQSGASLAWTSDAKDLYYQGTTDKTPPVTASIIYTLDGAAGTAESFAGKSGHMVMRVALQNNESEIRTIAGRERTVYTPFATVVAADLPVESFCNIAAQHGTVQTDANNQLVCFLALPGMAKTFDGLLTGEMAEIRNYLLDEVVIEADVTDFAAPTVMIAAATDASALDEKIDVPDLSGQMGQLNDATAQMQTGTATLAQATGTLQAKMNEFAAQYANFDIGIDSALAGTKQVKTGAQDLLAGAQALQGGSAQLAEGTQTLQIGSAQLAASLNDRLVPGLTGALAQKQVMQDKMTQMKGQLGSLTLPDIAALKTQLGAGVGQVFDAAATGAATVAAQQVGSSVVTGCKTVAEAAIDGAAPIAAAAVASAAADAVRAALSASLAGSGLPDDQVAVIIDGAAGAASAAGAAEIATGLKGAVTGAVDANVSVDAAAVAAQITAGMANAKTAAVSQITAALDGVDMSSLQGLLGEFGTLTDQADSLLGSVDVLAGSLYNTVDPTDVNTVVGAANAIAGGAQSAKEGAATLHLGAGKLTSGAAALSGGADTLQNGLVQLSGASKTVKDAIGQFQTGAAQLADGSSTLQNGMDTYARDAIGKLTSKLDANTLNALAETLDAVQQCAQSYTNYTGCAEGTQCSVKFVMKTQGAAKASATKSDTVAAESQKSTAPDPFWTRVKNLFA